jgi:hypothetical protein
MSNLFDDVARIVASPVSRRQAFRLVSGAVGGAVLASLGLGRATRALAKKVPATSCPPAQVCGTACCSASQFCATCTNGGTKCCAKGTICCTNPKTNKNQCCVANPSAANPCQGATKCA